MCALIIAYKHLDVTQFLTMFIEAFLNQLLPYLCNFFITDDVNLRSSIHK